VSEREQHEAAGPAGAAHRRRTARAALPAALLAVAAFAGCIRKPEVHLSDIRISGMSFRKIDLICAFKVLNPNVWDARLSDFDYTLSAAGQEISRGAAPKPIPKVPALGSAIVPVAASIELAEVARVVRAYRRGGPIPYCLSARPVFSVAGLPVRVTMNHIGQLPRLEPPKWRLKDVSLRRAPRRAILLTFEIENRCGLDLVLEGLSGRLTLGGETILQLDQPSVTELPEGQKVDVIVPVRIGLAGAARAATEAALNRRDLKFDGDFRLQPPPSLRQLLLGKPSQR